MILIVAEHADGKLTPITYELAAMARPVAQELERTLAVVVLSNTVDSVQDELQGLDLDQIILIRDPKLERYTSDGYVAALGALIAAKEPFLVISGHTSVGYDFIPRLAAGICSTYPLGRVRLVLDERCRPHLPSRSLDEP